MRKTEEEPAAVVAFRTVGGGTSRAGHSSTLAISHMIAKREGGNTFRSRSTRMKNGHQVHAAHTYSPNIFFKKSPRLLGHKLLFVRSRVLRLDLIIRFLFQFFRKIMSREKMSGEGGGVLQKKVTRRNFFLALFLFLYENEEEAERQ